jgi:DNA-binding SARP family transcriptional activator
MHWIMYQQRFVPDPLQMVYSSTMTSPLEIRLLGGLSVAADGPVRFPTRKTGLLFAYLAMHAGEEVARDRVKTLLWSDRSEQQASGSLRRALADMRKSLDIGLDSQALLSTQSTVALAADAVDVDALRFQELAAASSEDDSARAAELYRCDLLAEIAAPDPVFEDWLRVERERLRSMAIALAERLAESAVTESALAAATDLANRLLRADPVCEEAHRALIIGYRKAGRTGRGRPLEGDDVLVARRNLSR